MELQKRNELISNNIYLVEIQARMRKKRQPSLELDDLMSAGYSGLIKAADSYNEQLGPFESYAPKFILGAIIDDIKGTRRWGRWFPKNIEVSSFEDCDNEPLMPKSSDFEDMISGLKSSEQEIMRLYYVGKMPYREIGELLEVSEARISQRIKCLIQKIRRSNFGREL